MGELMPVLNLQSLATFKAIRSDHLNLCRVKRDADTITNLCLPPQHSVAKHMTMTVNSRIIMIAASPTTK